MAKRIRYEVRPAPKADDPLRPEQSGLRWIVTRDRARLSRHFTQADAVAFAAATARQDWRAAGVLAELVIKGRDGRIRDSRTYGRDPRSIKG